MQVFVDVQAKQSTVVEKLTRQQFSLKGLKTKYLFHLKNSLTNTCFTFIL